jgi:hypothetical protein
MDVEELTKLVDMGLTQRQIAESLGCSHTSVRYWLDKEGLHTSATRAASIEDAPCTKCNRSWPFETYGRMRHCTDCFNAGRYATNRENRHRAIQLCGGKCEVCDYDRCEAALDFHHPDPSKKDPFFQSLFGRSWANIEIEISKCNLLCANCHREAHFLAVISPTAS